MLAYGGSSCLEGKPPYHTQRISCGSRLSKRLVMSRVDGNELDDLDTSDREELLREHSEYDPMAASSNGGAAAGTVTPPCNAGHMRMRALKHFVLLLCVRNAHVADRKLEISILVALALSFLSLIACF
jgi:hypothetical protein